MGRLAGPGLSSQCCHRSKAQHPSYAAVQFCQTDTTSSILHIPTSICLFSPIQNQVTAHNASDIINTITESSSSTICKGKPTPPASTLPSTVAYIVPQSGSAVGIKTASCSLSYQNHKEPPSPWDQFPLPPLTKANHSRISQPHGYPQDTAFYHN